MAMATAPRFQMVSDRLLTGKAHPVLSGLIEALPPAGAEFSAAERDAWIDMVRNAFVLAYGPVAASRPAVAPARNPAAHKARAARSAPAPVRGSKPRVAGPAFFIDRQGFARTRGGERIMPNQVGGILVDLRGQNGDLATITWADDSRGIPKGLQLDIGIADGNE